MADTNIVLSPAAVERLKKDAFDHGYLIAVSNLMNMHDDPVAAIDMLGALGLSSAQMERLDLDDYDLAPLRALYREMERVDRLSRSKAERKAA